MILWGKMDSQRVKRLEQILARRRRIVVSIAEAEFMVRKKEHATPVIEPTSLPLEIVMQNSPRKFLIDGAPLEIAPKMSVERCSKKDLIETARMEKAVDTPKKDLMTAMETERSLEIATSVSCFLASTSPTGSSDPMLRAPSVGENLQSIAENLRNLLPPVERSFLNKQKKEK